MPDIGWTEFLVIALLAIVVIGPKDLPRVMREMGRWTAAARRAAREFQASLEELAREADLDDLNAKADSQGLRRKADYVVPGAPQADPTQTARAALPPPGEPFLPPDEHVDEQAPSSPPPKGTAS